MTVTGIAQTSPSILVNTHILLSFLKNKELKCYSFAALDIMLNEYIVLFSKKADNIGLIQCCLRF